MMLYRFCEVCKKHYQNVAGCPVCQMRRDRDRAAQTGQRSERIPAKVDDLRGELVHLVRRAICRKFGHKMVDCSTAGPDSGDMDCACERCGQYWDIPLY